MKRAQIENDKELQEHYHTRIQENQKTLRGALPSKYTIPKILRFKKTITPKTKKYRIFLTLDFIGS